MSKNVLGHIDCPTCGHEKAMRVKHDKNGEPFGFCEICRQQLRVGGDPDRVEEFTTRYPWAGKAKPVTVSEPAAKTAPVAPAPVSVSVPESKPQRSAFADAVAFMQGRATT